MVEDTSRDVSDVIATGQPDIAQFDVSQSATVHAEAIGRCRAYM